MKREMVGTAGMQHDGTISFTTLRGHEHHMNTICTDRINY